MIGCAAQCPVRENHRIVVRVDPVSAATCVRAWPLFALLFLDEVADQVTAVMRGHQNGGLSRSARRRRVPAAFSRTAPRPSRRFVFSRGSPTARSSRTSSAAARARRVGRDRCPVDTRPCAARNPAAMGCPPGITPATVAAFPSPPVRLNPAATRRIAPIRTIDAPAPSMIPPAIARTFVLDSKHPPPTEPTSGTDALGHEIRHGEFGLLPTFGCCPWGLDGFAPLPGLGPGVPFPVRGPGSTFGGWGAGIVSTSYSLARDPTR